LPTGFKILAVDPGSTSTKIALYVDEHAEFTAVLRHSDTELKPFRDRRILDQQQFRLAQIESALADAQIKIRDLHAVVGRGGLLPPLASGTYVVDEDMREELRLAPRGEHASNLGAFLAHALASEAGVRAYVVDPVSVDEWTDVARLSGCAVLDRQCLSHALNSKAVAKRYARECGKGYESMRLIVCHLGSGISVSAHENARMIDVTNSREEGAFSADRAGGVPAMQLVQLCFSGKYRQKEIEQLLFREGGLYSYLGAKDLMEVERRIVAGDGQAAKVYEAMVYQIAKEIGAMATVLKGSVEAILLTGGMAHSGRLVAGITDRVRWIAPTKVYPGEDELQALAEGVLRVLRHEEPARAFTWNVSVPTSALGTSV
jgi:butyrate kinase